MTISFNDGVRVREDVLISALEEESVILNLKSECYFGLDAMGTKIFEALVRSSSIESAFRLLAEEYDVDESTLRRDLGYFVEQLAAQGLIDVVLESSSVNASKS